MPAQAADWMTTVCSPMETIRPSTIIHRAAANMVIIEACELPNHTEKI
jgi:hypothetical protein